MKKKPIAKKKTKKVMKKKVTRAVSKKKVLAKKKPMKTAKAKKVMMKKTSRAMTASKKKAVTASSKKVTEKLLGKVVHYYDRIGVAIVDLNGPLKLGDMVQLQRGERILTQAVTSLQIEHQPVAMAKKGDVVGMKVDQEVQSGTKVMPV